MDSHAASRLWELARGNVLYLRHIVEREIADGRLKKLHGYWQWIGDPIMACGLVELLESRIGALPAEAGEVIDTLAVGEPIELTALKRIAGPDAVEEADTRGLITLDRSTAASKFGWRTRSTARCAGNGPPTRLRRLRGLVVPNWLQGRPRRHPSGHPARHLERRLRPPPDVGLLMQGRPRGYGFVAAAPPNYSAACAVLVEAAAADTVATTSFDFQRPEFR